MKVTATVIPLFLVVSRNATTYFFKLNNAITGACPGYDLSPGLT